MHRTRAQRFDDLVLQAVARLEPRWEAQLAGVEFGVEEIPPTAVLSAPGPVPVPLARLEPGRAGAPGGGTGGLAADGIRRDLLIRPDTASAAAGDGTPPAPPRIVIYRRPLLARADDEDDLGELVFDVIVEEFARLLGLDPEDVDPGYAGED